MVQMPIVSLLDEARRLAEREQRVSVLWQKPDSLVFVARGREYRSEFHINPSDETMYMIKGQMNLHYRTPEGKEEVAIIPEGSVIYTPAGVPHSPRFPPDAFALISERKRHSQQDCPARVGLGVVRTNGDLVGGNDLQKTPELVLRDTRGNFFRGLPFLQVTHNTLVMGHRAKLFL